MKSRIREGKAVSPFVAQWPVLHGLEKNSPLFYCNFTTDTNLHVSKVTAESTSTDPLI